MIIAIISNNILVIGPAIKQDLFFQYFLPLVGPTIVIATFWMNYKKDKKNKRKEAKRAWYFKAYFEPSIKKVEIFFDDSAALMSEAIETFNKSYEDDVNMEDRIRMVTLALANLASKKRRFLIEVVDVLKISYKDEALMIEELLNEFEDAGTTVFGKLDIAIESDRFFIYLSEITTLKALLIKNLSRPALLLKKSRKLYSEDSYADDKNIMV